MFGFLGSVTMTRCIDLESCTLHSEVLVDLDA